MTILLSRLFSPATLLATALSPQASLALHPVRTRSPGPIESLQVPRSALASNRLLDTVFGLPPMREERPYAL
jgi:hypothetical protein